jgi:hypothetical protein
MRLIAGILLIGTAILLPTMASGEEEQKPVQIVLYPSPEAKPALKYQLLPPFLERRPGNAAVWWNRVTAERSNFYANLYAEGGLWDKIEKWMDIPLGDPREKAYREKELAKDIGILSPGGLFLDMERAARFESCDWQLPIHEGNPYEILLPEIQQSRTFARLLSAKAQAVRTLQTGYAQARHVAQAPTFVSSLVGVTIAGIMSYQVQQFIQQPDAPNLYWALSTLPRPLVDFRPGGEAESNMIYLQWPELCDLDKKQLSPEEWDKLLNKIVEDNRKMSQFDQNGKDIAITAVSPLQNYPEAKRYLIDHGRAVAEVEAMPKAQVVLLCSVQLYEELNDDQFKWFFLPADEMGTKYQQAEQQMKEALAAKQKIFPIISFWLPAMMGAKSAEMRCARSIAILRIFEAMRLYAAAHDGKWPDRLSDITEVPIPLNPCDGKPFLYERHGDKAAVNSDKGPMNVPWRYEITLMQSKKDPKPSP